MHKEIADLSIKCNELYNRINKELSNRMKTEGIRPKALQGFFPYTTLLSKKDGIRESLNVLKMCEVEAKRLSSMEDFEVFSNEMEEIGWDCKPFAWHFHSNLSTLSHCVKRMEEDIEAELQRLGFDEETIQPIKKDATDLRNSVAEYYGHHQQDVELTTLSENLRERYESKGQRDQPSFR